jgi:hypothetical protein
LNDSSGVGEISIADKVNEEEKRWTEAAKEGVSISETAPEAWTGGGILTLSRKRGLVTYICTKITAVRHPRLQNFD